MTTRLVGADPAALDALATEVTEAASRLRLAQRVINGPLHMAPWFGQYAGVFRSKWDDQLTGSLFRSADFLDAAAAELRRQAEEQRSASDAGRTPPISWEQCSLPPAKDPEDAVRDFLLGLGLTLDQIEDLLKRFKGMLGKLNDVLGDPAIAGFLKTLGQVTDVLDVVTDFFDDLAENAHLALDEALVHAFAETAVRFVASEGGDWVGQVLTTTIMSIIAPGPGTAASMVVGKAVGFIVDKVVEAGMDMVDDQFNVYDGAGDLAVDAYLYAKERDFDGARILRDAAVDGVQAVGEEIKDGAENLVDGLQDGADAVRGWFGWN